MDKIPGEIDYEGLSRSVCLASWFTHFVLVFLLMPVILWQLDVHKFNGSLGLWELFDRNDPFNAYILSLLSIIGVMNTACVTVLMEAGEAVEAMTILPPMYWPILISLVFMIVAMITRGLWALIVSHLFLLSSYTLVSYLVFDRETVHDFMGTLYRFSQCGG